jgi:glycosyltransferase involved in cell wall biosynthesis
MAEPVFIVLTPAFAAFEGDAWVSGVEDFVRGCNQVAPSLKIKVLSFHFPVKDESEYTWFGNDVVTFSGAHKRGKIRSLMRWKHVWARLDSIRARHEIVGMLSIFCSECAFVGHYYARRHGLNHKIWVMGQDARKSNNQVRRIRPKAEELICISDFLVSEFERNHSIRPQHMIPCGILKDHFSESSVPRDIDILCVGSLIPLKQFELLIDVVKELRIDFPNINAYLVGGGPERKGIETAIHAAGLQHHIHLTQRIPHDEVLSMMKRCKVLLHPSSYEGLGLVCLEGLASGAQVISFCKPFDREIQNWHVVSSLDDMIVQSRKLLQEPILGECVMPFEAKETANGILNLFGLSKL